MFINIKIIIIVNDDLGIIVILDRSDNNRDVDVVGVIDSGGGESVFECFEVFIVLLTVALVLELDVLIVFLFEE